jgi:predicted peptidase
LIIHVRDTYPVDGNRLYLMGHSMGAAGTWDFMWTEPDLFAAGVPMSGCLANYQAKAPAVVDIPVWFFWGANDSPGMQAGYPMDTINALKALGGQPRYTEYPNLDHNTPPTVFNEPDLFPWLFTQQVPEPGSALLLAANAGLLLLRGRPLGKPD